MPLIRGVILIIVVSVFSTIKAQVIGVDTTGERYKYDQFGYSTVRYFRESDFFITDTLGRKLDTTGHKDLRAQYYDKGQYEPYQDLGTIGSSQKAYFYQAPTEIGVELGMNTLNRYAIQPEDIPYFDTQSPFSQLLYNRTVEFQESLDATFARSIDDRSGVGFKFRRMSGRHTFGANSNRIPYASNYAAYINGFYTTRNKKLKLLGSYRWFNHTIVENGGVLVSYSDSLDSSPFESNALSILNTNGIKSQDRRNGWHGTAIYSIVDTMGTLNAFYSFDRIRRVNYYRDNQYNQNRDIVANSNINYYRQVTGDPAGYTGSPGYIQDSTVFDRIEHKVGLGGYKKGLQYTAYYKLRNYNFYRNDSLITGKFYERFLGAKLHYKFNNDFYGGGSIESGSSDQYIINAEASFKWINAEYSRSSRVASIMEQQYLGQVYQWDNDFRNKENEQLKVSLNLFWKGFRFKPFYEISAVDHAIYYGANARPVQHDSRISTKAIGAEIHFDWRIFHVTNYYKNFKVNGYDIYHAPENYNFTRVAVDANFFERKLKAQFGVDVTYRSSFESMYYMPLIQQFYINDENPYTLKEYAVVDLFMSGVVKNFTIYFKLKHLNQKASSGYFIAPNYPGVKRSFEFGINWNFYK